MRIQTIEDDGIKYLKNKIKNRTNWNNNFILITRSF